MNTKEAQEILETQIGNIKAILNADVRSSIVCHSNGKCEYKLIFTYDKPIDEMEEHAKSLPPFVL